MRYLVAIGVLVFGLGAAMKVPSAATADGQQQQQESPDPAKPLLTISGDAALITVLIKPDKTAEFELVLAKLKEALRNNPKAQRKAQAAGWKIFKSTQPAQGNAVYIMRIDPVVKGEEYDITRLIAEVFPVEVQEIFPKYKDAFAGRGITELVPFMSMSE
jgi:hypothetical protein